jgi:tRNA/tmRNA/rRNA uracil-C5-methylase (TrmA/RlmC/RlmD family)
MARNLSTHDIVELDITDIAYGGDGVGRMDNCVIFVPFTITGETVRARIVRRRKRYYFAEPEEIITPSPRRVAPFCRYYHTCGGCQYQHIDYREQLPVLKKQLIDLMVRIGEFSEDIPVADMLPSPKTRGYRNRIDLHPGNEDTYGFCIRRTRPPQIFPLEQCPLFELQDNFSHYPFRRPDQLLVVRTHSGKPYCYFKDEHNEVMSGPYDLASREPLESEDIFFDIAGRTFRASYAGFFQVNLAILPALLRVVREFAQPKPEDTLLDVYCGVGLFGLLLADSVKRVMGVEVHKNSIDYANTNAHAFGYTHCEFTAEAAETYLRRLREEETHIDVCILDPPRNGLTNKVVSSLKRIRPQTLVYVSCGPSTFARDARKFVDAGYTLSAIQPLDLFPQTKHFELVARFMYNEPSK